MVENFDGGICNLFFENMEQSGIIEANIASVIRYCLERLLKNVDDVFNLLHCEMNRVKMNCTMILKANKENVHKTLNTGFLGGL